MIDLGVCPIPAFAASDVINRGMVENHHRTKNKKWTGQLPRYPISVPERHVADKVVNRASKWPLVEALLTSTNSFLCRDWTP